MGGDPLPTLLPSDLPTFPLPPSPFRIQLSPPVINNPRMAPINPATRRAELDRLLSLAHRHAIAYLHTLDERPVIGDRTLEDLRAALGGELPDHGELPDAVIESMGHEGAAAAIASAGPRFFGFVIGGSLPVAVAADWLTSAWDQNSGLYVAAPAVSVMEETAARWLAESSAPVVPARSGSAQRPRR